jgi:hypothetical protein
VGVETQALKCNERYQNKNENAKLKKRTRKFTHLVQVDQADAQSKAPALGSESQMSATPEAVEYNLAASAT